LLNIYIYFLFNLWLWTCSYALILDNCIRFVNVHVSVGAYELVTKNYCNFSMLPAVI
jgi:hypothetical protein